MALIDALKRQLEHAQNLLTEIDEKRAKLNADYHEQWHYVADLDTAIAALEPAPAELVSEPEPEPILFESITAEDFGTITITEDLSLTEAEIDALADEDEPEEHISILTGDPAVEGESGLRVWTAKELQHIDILTALSADPEPTELDAPASIVDDPELQAAVARAEATLAKDEPAYVGLQDADLDAEWDAMKAREEAEKPKPRFSIFGRIKEDA